MAASFAEANERFRPNVLGDDRAELPFLEHNGEDDAEPVTNGRRRKAAAK